MKKRSRRLALAVVSALLLHGFFAGEEALPREYAAGFWGMLYPKWCFAKEAPTDENGEQLPVKLTFRWLHGFSKNDKIEKNEWE